MGSLQDRLCLLGRLYERWIDCSLLAHLPRPDSPVRRKKRHNHVEEEEVIQVAGENTSTRLALSTQEARVLGRLGEGLKIQDRGGPSEARIRISAASSSSRWRNGGLKRAARCLKSSSKLNARLPNTTVSNNK